MLKKIYTNCRQNAIPQFFTSEKNRLSNQKPRTSNEASLTIHSCNANFLSYYQYSIL